MRTNTPAMMPIMSGVFSEVPSALGFWRAWKVELSRLARGVVERGRIGTGVGKVELWVQFAL